MSAETFDEFPIILAPMYRGVDAALRASCHQAGADMSYFVMLAVPDPAGVPQIFPEVDGRVQSQMTTAVQLIGSDALAMARQAAFLEDAYGDSLAAIDLNMGCPMERILSRGAGAALMEDVECAERIIGQVARAIHLPVSVKFRKGPRRSQETAAEFARMAEASGATSLTVHGRTTDQMFEGEADKSVIERVKAAVSIPVYASGDIRSADDVRAYRDLGADGVMIGRAARENPQVFHEIKNDLRLSC